MTSPTKAPPLYPKSHILAASGVAALLSLALLVFPSREVEAKKTYLNLELDSGAEYAELQDDAESANTQARQSPFANTAATETPDEQPTAQAVEPEQTDPLHLSLIHI